MPAFRQAPLYEIVYRLLVYILLAAASASIWLGIGWLIVSAASGQDLPAVYVPFRWTVNTARPARQDIEIRRGETVALEPQYTSYDGPVSLSNVYLVTLRYRTPDMAADTYYAATGSVLSASGGTVRIVWGPAQDTGAALYQYDIRLAGNDSVSLKAFGTIRMQGSMMGVHTNQPAVVSGQFDWAAVEHLNIDHAPFAVDASSWRNPASATNWTWTSDGTQITLTGYTGPNAVVIPDMLDGLPVTTLGESIFDYYDITSVYGGENLTSIGRGAFDGCGNLTSISFPSVTTIGDYAFSLCATLTSIRLPAGTTFGIRVFDHCANLTAVYFGQDAPEESALFYRNASNVINYVTNPTATGWGATWNDRPVVRLGVTADDFVASGKTPGTQYAITTTGLEEVTGGSGGTGAVLSVNGQTGVVVLDAVDVGSVATNDPAHVAAMTNVTGTGGIVISGEGRNRAIDGSAFLQWTTSTDGALALQYVLPWDRLPDDTVDQGSIYLSRTQMVVYDVAGAMVLDLLYGSNPRGYGTWDFDGLNVGGTNQIERINQGVVAHGWGDHADAGYLVATNIATWPTAITAPTNLTLSAANGLLVRYAVASNITAMVATPLPADQIAWQEVMLYRASTNISVQFPTNNFAWRGSQPLAARTNWHIALSWSDATVDAVVIRGAE
jgi:hypothetical protein